MFGFYRDGKNPLQRLHNRDCFEKLPMSQCKVGSQPVKADDKACKFSSEVWGPFWHLKKSWPNLLILGLPTGVNKRQQKDLSSDICASHNEDSPSKTRARDSNGRDPHHEVEC